MWGTCGYLRLSGERPFYPKTGNLECAGHLGRDGPKRCMAARPPSVLAILPQSQSPLLQTPDIQAPRESGCEASDHGYEEKVSPQVSNLFPSRKASLRKRQEHLHRQWNFLPFQQNCQRRFSLRRQSGITTVRSVSADCKRHVATFNVAAQSLVGDAATRSRTNLMNTSLVVPTLQPANHTSALR
jgi:hypothetical protein